MPTQPEQKTTPPPLSSRMEQRLVVEEARNTKRTRQRKAPCVMPKCGSEVHRNNEFPLCINHLLLVWKHVDAGETVSEWSKQNGNWLERINVSHIPTSEEVEARQLANRQRQREIATTPGHLYALDTGCETVKLGWTKRDLWQRLEEYPPHFRLIVTVPGTRADEQDVHRALKIFRAAKHEWYFVEAEVARQINTWIALANTIEVQRAADSRRKYGASNPGSSFAPNLLPAFTSLSEWTVDGRVGPHYREPKPAPQSRLAARRVG